MSWVEILCIAFDGFYLFFRLLFSCGNCFVSSFFYCFPIAKVFYEQEYKGEFRILNMLLIKGIKGIKLIYCGVMFHLLCFYYDM